MSAALEQTEYVNTVGIPMRRVWAMSSKNTFDIPPIRALVKTYLNQSKVSIDPFARNKRWATYTNDLNPDTAADCHLSALDFLTALKADGVMADVIIFDPPYSTTQIKECYAGIGMNVDGLSFADYSQMGNWTKEKDLCAELLSAGGVFLHFGWHSNGLGLKRGCQIEDILLVAHGRCHNDTICTVERKVESAQSELFTLAS